MEQTSGAMWRGVAPGIDRIAPAFEGTQPRRAVLKCTKIVESSDDSHTPEVRATIVSCGPTAPLVVRRARIVAAQLDIYRPSPWPSGESGRTALFPSS